MKNYANVILLVFLCICSFSFGQESVSGKITDKKTGDPIAEVKVQVVGTNIGTLTDFNGEYSLKLPEGADSLVFKSLDFEKLTVAINGRSVINTALSSLVQKLEGVVVTALGIKRDEKALGYAVTTLDGDNIRKSNQTNVANSLSGVVAGANVTNASGAAGSGSRVVLRGFASLTGNNEALYVIDGVKVNNDSYVLGGESSTESVSNSNRGIDINPEDIESVSVLKGGAATALYGIDGANGVIVITTKKGSNNENTVQVNAGTSLTVSQVNRLPQLQQQYSQGSAWYSTDGVTPEYLGPETGWLTSWGPSYNDLTYDSSVDNPYDQNGSIILKPNASDPSVNIYDNLGDFFRNGISAKNNFTISSGNKNASYRLSVSDVRESGVVPLNTFKRTNVSFASGLNLFEDKLNIVTTANYINSGGRRIQQGSNLSGIMLGLLRTPITFDNSNGIDSKPWNDPSAYELVDGSQRNYRGGGGYDNPFWSVNKNQFYDNVNRIIGNVQASYEFSKWAVLGMNVGLDRYSDDRRQTYAIGSRAFPNGKIVEQTIGVSQTDAYLTMSGKGYINADKTLDLTYIVGLNAFNYNTDNLYTVGNGFAFEGFENLANASTINSTNTIDNYKSLSGFTSIDLGYKSMLYLTLTGRQDYDSRFIVPSKEFKMADIGFGYPSVSSSFVFSELFAKKKGRIMDFGKLRISWAQIAKGPNLSYATTTTYGTVSVGDGWTNGYSFPYQSLTSLLLGNTQGNTQLVPEKSNEFEVGTYLAFFNNRLTVDVAYYNRKTKDAILSAAVSATSGYTSTILNTGEMHTNGVDVAVRGVLVKKKDFYWSLGSTFSKYKTIVDKLANGLDQLFVAGFTGTGIYHIPGEEFGQIYGGDYARTEDGTLIIDDDPSSATYGYPIADPELKVIGNPNPKFLLGINSSVEVKRFSLSFLIDMKVGGQMWNGTQGALTFFGMSALTEDRDLPGNTSHVFEGTPGHYDADGNLIVGSGENDVEVGLNEDWYTGNGGGFGSVSSQFIQNASTYRLRNITVGYDIPVKGRHVKELNVFLTGNNLLLFTPYEGIDPETSLTGSSSNGQGLDYFNMPNTRSVTIGLNIKL
ncbi:MAG: SusC/RagA family TonB-linked outer membrane protein [Crocinitomicaceae bacterium]|nr:SusC/RagA family TonB-linked outer membrane protein [Crocinitomicaceae bacterium]